MPDASNPNHISSAASVASSVFSRKHATNSSSSNAKYTSTGYDPFTPPDPTDPLAHMLAAPPDESPAERAARERREAAARALSESIDAELRRERQQMKKRREKVVKLLLLGQSESGKSTTLRQFQRLYTPNAFRDERILWRSVIQLNVLRSVRAILDALAADAAAADALDAVRASRAAARAASRIRNESLSGPSASGSGSQAQPSRVHNTHGRGRERVRDHTTHARTASTTTTGTKVVAGAGPALYAPTGGGASDDEDDFGFGAVNGYNYATPPGLGGMVYSDGDDEYEEEVWSDEDAGRDAAPQASSVNAVSTSFSTFTPKSKSKSKSKSHSQSQSQYRSRSRSDSEPDPIAPANVASFASSTSDAVWRAQMHERALRLLPLRAAEQLLAARLVPPGEDEATQFGGFASEVANNGDGGNGTKIGNGNTDSASTKDSKGKNGLIGIGTGSILGGGIGLGSIFGSTASSTSAVAGGEIFVRHGARWKGCVAAAAAAAASASSSAFAATSTLTPPLPSLLPLPAEGKSKSKSKKTKKAANSKVNGVESFGSVGSVGSVGTVGSGDSVSSGGSFSGSGSGSQMHTVGVDEPTAALHALRGELRALWNDPGVRACLRKRKVRVEEMPGFFLDDLPRITSLTYLPSDDDVLKARLKTVGVSEYNFAMETAAGRESGHHEWRIFDVGGSRSQRPTWVPFFDDVDAIIFLAPISCFDQVLAEDRTVNRLEDSVLLWKMICSNKLLAHVELVLFLNKCDILERKLERGVRLARYVRSFHDRANDSETVQKYFKAKFAAIQREYSPNPRKFYGFCTSVTEITTTSGILASVRDMVIREHLKRSKLL